MDEDLELNRYIKSALEAKPPFALKSRRGVLAASERRPQLLPWATATLFAATLALIATFHLPRREDPSSVEDVIRLLSEAENMTLVENGSATSVDLLLAWQERGADVGLIQGRCDSARGD